MNAIEAQHFHKIRRVLVDSRSTIDAVVLRPICDNCLIDLGVSPIRFLDRYDPVVLWPRDEETHPRFERTYDRGTGTVNFWGTQRGCRHVVDCSQCHRHICTLTEDSTIRVFEEDFTERFGIEEPVHDDPLPRKRQRVRSNVRETIRRLYGGHCFECGVRIPSDEKFEVDHIHSRSKRGTESLINLQLLCLSCGNKKGKTPQSSISPSRWICTFVRYRQTHSKGFGRHNLWFVLSFLTLEFGSQTLSFYYVGEALYFLSHDRYNVMYNTRSIMFSITYWMDGVNAGGVVNKTERGASGGDRG